MKTSLIAKMLLTLLVLIFSGCTKTIYVPVACAIEKPTKTDKQNCSLLKSDLDFMQCVAENYTNLEGDYEALEKAFEGCK